MKIAAVILTLAFAVPATAGTPKDIVDTARSAGSFDTLIAAAKAAGLVDALKGDGPFTVFAPTDGAFAALPEGAVAGLLRPENRDRLRAILTSHVVSGRVLAGDLAPVRKVTSLGGATFDVGLRIGDANVVEADILCSNGVIHVIDKVLIPPRTEADRAAAVVKTIEAAIGKGAPLYNQGDIRGCATTYEAAARSLLAGEDLRELHRDLLSRVMTARATEPRDRAWALRHAFDRIWNDIEFEPVVEAELPPGFPTPRLVGRVEVREYPAYRAARAAGDNSFWTLFRHIKKNDVRMTAPVEMTLDDSMRAKDMAFLYEHSKQGSTGSDGSVAVLDLPAVTVLSIGLRGNRDEAEMKRARALLEKSMKESGWKASGEYRLLGYNSPMVPAARKYWELQVPVTR